MRRDPPAATGVSTLLTIGAAFGALAGLLHACTIYAAELRRERLRSGANAGATHGRAAYFALWTFALWVVFGTYVLVLWLVAAPLWAVSRFRRRSPSPGDEPAHRVF